MLETDGARLHALLTRLTLREDVAEDLLQELFLRLDKSAGWAEASDPVAFARRAAIHLAFDWRRTQKRMPPTARMQAEPASRQPPPWQMLAQAEQFNELLDAANELPPAMREAFILRRVDGEEYTAIAAALGKTPHQARALCHKAAVCLREILTRREGGQPRGVNYVEPR